MLHITQAERDGTLTVSLAGELDHHAARMAIEQTEDLLVLYPCGRLVLELSGLTFMDSSGAGGRAASAPHLRPQRAGIYRARRAAPAHAGV